MRRLPPQAQLRAFEAAARHGSFRKAAEELCVTPTAISHHVRALEAFCGQPLFRRRPRPVSLTEAGARLFPVVRQGLDAFAEALSAIGGDTEAHTLKVTTTAAFASRWLVPRLPLWRRANPDVALDVIGTQAVIDLEDGGADVAIRYMAIAPRGLVSHELFRDGFVLVGKPDLLPGETGGGRAGLERQTLIETLWSHPLAPTWQRWLAEARAVDPDFPAIGAAGTLSFTEELNAIEALVAGQGIGVCSDVLARRELESGTLVKVADFAMPGLGFYLVHVPDHPRRALIDRFLAWARAVG